MIASEVLEHIPADEVAMAELARVLRPGGAFLGSDSLGSDGLHQFHEGDTYNPVEPSAFLVRLQTVGFTAITLELPCAS